MPPRDRILDAAARVLREKGLARATTKEIARAAGYSEAMLYKYFADKHEIFLGVLRERVRAPDAPGGLAGTDTVRANLARITAGLIRFYLQTFPMAASIFGTPDLLAGWRDGMAARGAGPLGPQLMVERYLREEIALGRVDAGVDVPAVAILLCGAALQQAFLACFDGRDGVPDTEALTARLVAALALRGHDRVSTATGEGASVGPS